MLLSSVLADLVDIGIPPGEKVLRSLLVFGFLVLDLAVLLLVPNALQNAMIGQDDSLLGGIIGASVLFGANFLFVHLTYRSTWRNEGLVPAR